MNIGIHTRVTGAWSIVIRNVDVHAIKVTAADQTLLECALQVYQLLTGKKLVVRDEGLQIILLDVCAEKRTATFNLFGWMCC